MEDNKNNKFALLALVFSMAIFGSVGIFSRSVPLPSATVALSRSLIGAVAIILFMLITGKRADFSAIRKNAVYLIISGLALGVNWLLFFEACRQTTVQTATLSYYLEPIILVAVSPLVFGERLSVKKIICVITSLFGMVLISGIFGGASEGVTLRGIALGAAAAALYTTVVVMNKKMRDISPYDKTVVQFLLSVVLLLPYVLIFERPTPSDFTPSAIGMLAVIGILHTALTYVLYFGSARYLSADSIAVFSYIDPIVALALSAIFLKEIPNAAGIVGGVLILASAFISEIKIKFKKTNKNANNS